MTSGSFGFPNEIDLGPPKMEPIYPRLIGFDALDGPDARDAEGLFREAPDFLWALSLQCEADGRSRYVGTWHGGGWTHMAVEALQLLRLGPPADFMPLVLVDGLGETYDLGARVH